MIAFKSARGLFINDKDQTLLAFFSNRVSVPSCVLFTLCAVSFLFVYWFLAPSASKTLWTKSFLLLSAFTNIAVLITSATPIAFLPEVRPKFKAASTLGEISLVLKLSD